MKVEETPVTNEEARSRNRKSLLILFAIGFVPLTISWVVFFYFPQLMPTSTTNQGELISPPVHASELGLEGQIGDWTLIMPVGESCDELCNERLYLARQVNIALGRESSRVKRLVLWTNGTAAAQQIQGEYPELGTFPVSAEDLKSKLGESDRIYLMDPLGNIFMVYTVDKAGKPMLKDVKHLLKISNIG